MEINSNLEKKKDILVLYEPCILVMLKLGGQILINVSRIHHLDETVVLRIALLSERGTAAETLECAN